MSFEILASLLTLTVLEIVLGIDNIIFISILVARVPLEQRELARKLGLVFALATRVILLLCISWVVRLTTPWMTIGEMAISGRDIILILGGLFLIFKSTREIHLKIEGAHGTNHIADKKQGGKVFLNTIIQIGLLDIIFSLDSVITAVGMADEIWVMVVAVVLAMGIMLAFAKSVGDFVERHPTVKVLALSFLILIGVALLAEGFHQHISKGYIYFAMAFSAIVEFINIKVRSIKN